MPIEAFEKNSFCKVMRYLILFLFCFCGAYAMSCDGPIVFQPLFKWADGSVTQQGTGCLIRAPNGHILGLTSAHFINFQGPTLEEVEWLDVKTKQPIATSRESWGRPGHEGTYNPLDLRSDYLLLAMTTRCSPPPLLELDPRQKADLREPIWFPNKVSYKSIAGTVTTVCPEYILVTLEAKTDLQSCSGTPIISQRTGKIIGILTGGDAMGQTPLIFCAPSYPIYQAMLNANHCFPLKEVVGRPCCDNQP
jgi:hypothetical protein